MAPPGMAPPGMGPPGMGPPGMGPPGMGPPGMAPGPGAAAPKWTEHKAADGRSYYFCASTGESSWDKPDELKTPEERAMSQGPWKVYKTAEGREYYFHSVTKQSVWEKPPELGGTGPQRSYDTPEEKREAFMQLLVERCTSRTKWEDAAKMLQD